jgi:protease-4
MAAAIGISILIVAAFVMVALLLGGRGSARQPLFGGKVGLVEIKGVIADSKAALEALDEFRRDDAVRAVVLRVDSPGGGVGASQEIYQEVKRLAAVKPVVCSMGGVAASGGYYVAAPCTKIVANPGTLTGSIGVISTIPNIEGLLDKLGLKVQTIKTGALKGAGAIDRPLNDQERALMEQITKDLYNQFLGDVTASRHLGDKQVQAIGDSRVLTGRQALELGLVDELGNMVDALNLAAKLGNIPGRPKLVQPQEKQGNWLRGLLKEESRALLGQIVEQTQAQGSPMFLYSPSGG